MVESLQVKILIINICEVIPTDLSRSRILEISADCKVPEFDCFIVAPRHNVEIIELEAGHPVCMRLECLEPLASLQVPDFDHFVVSSGEDPPVVSLETPDDSGVSLVVHPVQRVETGVLGDAPDLDGSVQTA